MMVYAIAGNGGANEDDKAMDILTGAKDLLLVDSSSTFRGSYAWKSSKYGNPGTFPDKFIDGRDSALADQFILSTERRVGGDILKMGDSPSFLPLIDPWSANDLDPSKPSWGGQYKLVSGTTNKYEDREDMAATTYGRPRTFDGAGTVSQWADEFLGDWVERLGWAENSSPAATANNSSLF